MTTWTNRPHSALLVIDFQNGVVADVFERERVTAAINQLVDRARTSGTAVIWVQDVDGGRDEGSEAWQIIPELDPLPEEPRVQKRYGDAFEATNLEELLAAAGVGKLFISGAQTDACIRSTLHGAVTRGYDTILVGDAHTTEDLSEWGNPSPAAVIAHTNLYWQYHSVPDREVGTVAAAEVSF
ncbi:MAG: isochorismatase family protein [Propionibacteriales bacterium]|jgi:nicotinamidase-related amidase|nr:isochorismatase family protein [Propionibacteriales bacterium]